MGDAALTETVKYQRLFEFGCSNKDGATITNLSNTFYSVLLNPKRNTGEKRLLSDKSKITI